MKVFCLLIVLFLTAGCIKEYEEIPADILPEAKLVRLLADLHQEDAKITNRVRMGIDSVAALSRIGERKVLKRHKIDSLTYRKSIDWYQLHPHHYNRMYEIVVDTLAMREQTKILN